VKVKSGGSNYNYAFLTLKNVTYMTVKKKKMGKDVFVTGEEGKGRKCSRRYSYKDVNL